LSETGYLPRSSILREPIVCEYEIAH